MIWLLIGLVILIAIMAVALAGKKTSDEPSEVSSGYPYVKRETLLTEAEHSFLVVLEQAIGDRFRIYAQVRLADLLVVKSGLEKSQRTSAQNKINAKHVDFVLCDRQTLAIVCAIELDDASHQRESRKTRDAFLEQACAAAQLPLARFPVKSRYVASEIRTAIGSLLGLEMESALPPMPQGLALDAIAPLPASTAPACPKCGSETVLRSVRSGARAGSKLWGCRNFPSCKGYIPAEAEV